METTATPRATVLRRRMAALTAAQSTETLISAWIAAVVQRETAVGGQQQALDTALTVMATELLRRGVSQDTLDTALWAVRMEST